MVGKNTISQNTHTSKYTSIDFVKKYSYSLNISDVYKNQQMLQHIKKVVVYQAVKLFGYVLGQHNYYVGHLVPYCTV